MIRPTPSKYGRHGGVRHGFYRSIVEKVDTREEDDNKPE